MESQESDLCNQDEMELILGEPGVPGLLEAVDWSGVPVPESNPTGELPARNEWPGNHQFDTKVDLSGMHRKNYYVSSKLNKLFVDMEKIVPFQVKWDGTPNLFVRALMVFNLADASKQPVKRCVAHRDKDSPSNFRYENWDHVLATENDNAVYMVDPVSKRHSVVVPLHWQQGCDHAIINIKFMCKTSCPGGLNRSPTDIIFTLEDSNATVLGRQVIGVKICSCPKRDKEKEEENLGDPLGKKKTKVRREDKHLLTENCIEPPLKKIKQEFGPALSPYSTFVVRCANPQVAELAQDHLKKWNEIKAVEWSRPGSPINPPILDMWDHVAVLPTPIYNRFCDYFNLK